MTLTQLIAALVAELTDHEIPAPLTQRFTLATTLADLCRLAGEPLPPAVALLIDGAAQL